MADRAAAANPEGEWAQRLRCDALGALGRHPEALEAARRAVALAPREPLGLLGLVKALRATKDRPAARARAEELVALAPQKASSHETRALIALDDGQFGEAEAGMRRALALEPESATYHNNLGLVLLRQNRREEAVAAFEQAARIDPTLQVAHQNLAVGIRSHLHPGLRGFISDWVTRLFAGSNRSQLTPARRAVARLVVGLIAAGLYFLMTKAPEQVAPIVLLVLFGSLVIVPRLRLRRLSPTAQRFAAAQRLASPRSTLRRLGLALVVIPVFVGAIALAVLGLVDLKSRPDDWAWRALVASIAGATILVSWRLARRRRGDRGAG